MQSPTFEVALAEIVARDPRFAPEAYHFVREGLDFTQARLLKATPGASPRHVSGQELLAGLRDYALAQFGPMTCTVLEEWGVRRCEDFGEIVFNLVEHRLLSKTDQDTRADFQNGYDFDAAFRQPFRPTAHLPKPTPPVPEVPPKESPRG